MGLGEARTIAPGVVWLAPRLAGPAPDGATGVVVISGARHSLVFGTGQAYGDGRAILRVLERKGLARVRLAVIPAALPGYVFGATALQHAGLTVTTTAATAALIAQRCEQCLARLRASAGEVPMAGSRVPVIAPSLAGDASLALGAREVRLLDLGWAAEPGEVALFDGATGTLVSAEVVTGDALPQLHDASLDGWLAALARLEALSPRRVLSARHGLLPPAAIRQTRAYLLGLGEAVRTAYAAGLSLAETQRAVRLPGRGAEAARVHAANVQAVFLQLEQADLAGVEMPGGNAHSP